MSTQTAEVNELDCDDSGMYICPNCDGEGLNLGAKEEYDSICFEDAYEHYKLCLLNGKIDELEVKLDMEFESLTMSKDDPKFEDTVEEDARIYAEEYLWAYTRNADRCSLDLTCDLCEGEGLIDWVTYARNGGKND